MSYIEHSWNIVYIIQEMAKQSHKNQNSSDEWYLQQAVWTIHQVVCTINTSISKKDRDKELLDLRRAFNVSPLISEENPGRVLVRTGELQKLCHNGIKCKLNFVE